MIIVYILIFKYFFFYFARIENLKFKQRIEVFSCVSLMSTSKSPDIKKPQREVLKSGKSKAVLISISLAGISNGHVQSMLLLTKIDGQFSAVKNENRVRN
jgi:hypothetical protein